jgi:hypothetical protein
MDFQYFTWVGFGAAQNVTSVFPLLLDDEPELPQAPNVAAATRTPMPNANFLIDMIVLLILQTLYFTP